MLVAIWKLIAENSSSIIAICALILTVWQLFVTRRHNKLSVTPYLTTWSHIDHDNGNYSLDIMNNGVGPALIKTFQIFVDGRKVESQDLGLMEKTLEILFPTSVYKYSSYKSYLSDGYMMATNEKRNLVSIQFVGQNFPTPEEIKRISDRVKIIIEYESIYRQKLTYDSSKFKVIN